MDISRINLSVTREDDGTIEQIGMTWNGASDLVDFSSDIFSEDFLFSPDYVPAIGQEMPFGPFLLLCTEYRTQNRWGVVRFRKICNTHKEVEFKSMPPYDTWAPMETDNG